MKQQEGGSISGMSSRRASGLRPYPVHIGTSGYSYSWNEGKPTPFLWYLKQGLNSVEINGSFYRFPNTSWVKNWLKAPTDFDFSIKVNQAITHRSRMGPSSLDLWERFRGTLEDLEEKIAFWLFQMPPSFRASEENLTIIEKFLSSIHLGNKVVIEFREKEWWASKFQKRIEATGAVFCSVDSPELPREITTMNDSLYLRLHGRKSWYSDVYSEAQLDKISEKVRKSSASRRYIFLNNDHGMLPNAFYLKKKMEK